MLFFAISDLSTISKKFRLCKDMTSLEDFRHLLLWIRNAFGFLAMMDYPYPTNFMGELPAYPVKVSRDESQLSTSY